MTGPIITEQDIARLVPAFYDRVRCDPVLGPIFDGAIADWPHHLDKLQAFWSSVMRTTGRYKGQPMVAHLAHRQHMTRDNFDRWLMLWNSTATDHLDQDQAQAFGAKAARIAESLQLGMQYHRDESVAP